MGSDKLLYMKVNLLISLLLASILGYSYSDSSENSIIGKWKVTNCETQLKDLSPVFIANFKQDMLTTYYTFSENKTFKRISPIGNDSGTWLLNEEKNLLVMYNRKSNDSRPESYGYIFTTSSKMTWKYDYGDLGSFSLTLELVN